MTKAEKELMDHCLNYLLQFDWKAGEPMDESTLQWLHKVDELTKAVRTERANPEMVQFLRSGYQARVNATNAWKQVQEEARDRWGTDSVEDAMPLVWEGIRE